MNGQSPHTRESDPGVLKRKGSGERDGQSKKGKQHANSIYDGVSGDQSGVAFMPNVNYGVGWICALYLELAAAEGMLDKVHNRQAQPPGDSNTYVLGTMAGHNVVIACLPAGGYGSNNAAVVATNMRRSFPSLRVCLLVGIGGGISDPDADLRLGDVVVGESTYQYDLGKVHYEGRFVRNGSLRKPSHVLGTTISRIKSKHEHSPSDIVRYLDEMLARHPLMTAYSYPGQKLDRLFNSSYEHREDVGGSCESCDEAMLVLRRARPSNEPRIHYGVIASANQVVKHAHTRDRLAQELRNLCFEMEAAGLSDLPYVVVRGISDYSDSHKNDCWQRYAAATAAAYAKELLSSLPQMELPSKIEGNDASRGSSSSSDEAQSKPRAPIRGKTIQERINKVSGLKAGDSGTQMCVAGAGELWDLSDMTAGNGAVQFIGSTGGDSGMVELLKSLVRPRTPKKEEVVIQQTMSSRRSP